MLWQALTLSLAAVFGDVPAIQLDPQSGNLDSVRWKGTELIATANGLRKPLVVRSALRSVEGNTVRFETVETGSFVDVTFTPVEDGIDLQVVVEGNGLERIDLFLGQFSYQGAIGGLKPIYGGYLFEVDLLREQGQRYSYPGTASPTAFSPVYALWDSRHTVGFMAMAEIGQEFELQLWESQNTTAAGILDIGLVDGAKPGQVREYDLCIRFATGARKWREVLAPYKLHQFERDGPVRYERLGPTVFYNMRNSKYYDFTGDRDFEPGTTWEQALGVHWDNWLQARDAGALELGCVGVWCQQEQLEAWLEFNPDCLELEASLDGTLSDLVNRIRQDYEDVTLMALSRPGRKVVDNQIARRDITDPAEWAAAMAQLQGLADLGFDATYADQLGVERGWEWVDFIEASPVHIISEWEWDRLLTRASAVCVSDHYPSKDAGQLIAYFTPGGEMFIESRDHRDELFAQGIITPWNNWLTDETRQRFNMHASYMEASAIAQGAQNDPDDNINGLGLMWDGIGNPNMGPQPVREMGENPNQPDSIDDLVTLIVQPNSGGQDGGSDAPQVVRLIRGKSNLTLAEVQQLISDGARRIVVNRRRSVIPPPDTGDDGGQDQGDGGGDAN
ncbi:MAG: hypothetical protein ACF8NJ_04025 [Phycisphaerales bacterium JB038]